MRPVALERASDAIHARAFMHGTKNVISATYTTSQISRGAISHGSACANNHSALPV